SLFVSRLGEFTPELLKQVLGMIQLVQSELLRAYTLSDIAPHLGEFTTELKQALKMAYAIQDESLRADALSNIAPNLSKATPELQQQFINAVKTIKDKSSQTNALSNIVPQLNEFTPELIKHCLEGAQAIQNESIRIKVLSRIVPQLPDVENLVLNFSSNRLSVVLNLVKVQKTDQQKVQLLSAAAPRLALGLLPTALQLIAQQTIKNEQLRVEALSNLAPFFREQLPEAMKLCCTAASNSPEHNSSRRIPFDSEINRVEAICSLTLYLTNLEQYETVCATIKSSIHGPLHRANALVALSTELSTERVTEIILNTPEKLNLSKKDNPHTSQERFTAVVKDVWHMVESLSGDQWMNHRADILCRLVPSMSIEQIDNQVLPNLKSLFQYQNRETKHGCSEDTGYVSHILSAVAIRRTVSHPVHKDKEDDLTNYTKISNSKALVSDELGQVRILSKLPNDLAINLAKKIDSQFQRAEALVEIACYSSQDQHQYQALQAINRLPNTYLQSQHLKRLIPYLQPSQSLEAGRVIQEIKQAYYRTQALVTLACKFPQFRPEAKTAALALNDDIQKVEQLSLLAVEMPDILPEIIDILETLSPQDQEWLQTIKRKQLLVALAPHLPMRINREVNRRGSTGCSEDLWNRALYLLARGYRDALQGGSLRNESAQDQDLLNLQDEVNALADLLLMRDLEPPMAVGILGGWGGGKSYIMHLMQQHMTQVRSRAIDKVEAWNPNPNSEKLSPYVGHIYQIKFDAWTFAKSDLWASLMQTIFFELDRQLTLETQLNEVLKPLEENKRQAIESKVWPVLYKSSDDERQWFLKQVLKDENLLEELLKKQETEGHTGILWKKFSASQTAAINNLKTTEQTLRAKKLKLEQTKSELRNDIRQQFAPIFNLTESSQFQRLDAFFGTSFLLLRRRIGQNAFKNLNTEICKELFGKDSITGTQQEANKDIGKDSITGTQQEANKDKGEWAKLENKLQELETARATLEKLGRQSEVSPAEPSQKEADPKPDKSETLQARIADKQDEVNNLLRQVSEIKFNIFNVATNVIEKQQSPLNRERNLNWLKNNWLLVLLFLVLFVVPFLVLAVLGYNIFQDTNQEIENLTAKLATVIAPLLPGVAILQNLMRSGQKWFEETRLALHEYETSVEKRNKELEASYERTVQESLQANPRLRQLEQEVQQLEQAYEAQKQSTPVNQYASLSAFITDRLEQGTYKNRLGLMQQVKQDLADLSNKLLPPSQYEESFKDKVELLKPVFPRGPARVIVYIDDLDRCPPDRVVEVLEAVQLLVKTPLFIAVLAIDERYITRALEKYYDGVLSRRGRPSGTDYLEKIIQLPYRVRPIMPDTLDTYLRFQIVIQDGGTGGAKFSEFSRQEYDMLLACCEQVDLSPRTLKRLTNVYKLFKVVCRTRGTKPSTKVQKAILALLALSGRYPDLMRGIFNDIETCYEEKRTKQEAETLKKNLHLDSSLRDFFSKYRLPDSDQYLQREFEKLQHDALYTPILPDITLDTMGHSIFNLIRSFSFVGEIGEDPEDYRFSSPVIHGQVNGDEKSIIAEETQADS
ncbi:MAG: hypothetical protein F6K11_25105, partial [Leptolyngbya sp. SIO3F4]|nr:hypothetical protein [Leptolyngbya sp. SIO3F4]